jgi:hypothetical protein
MMLHREERKENVNLTFHVPTWDAPTPLLPNGDGSVIAKGPQAARQPRRCPPLTGQLYEALTRSIHTTNKSLGL